MIINAILLFFLMAVSLEASEPLSAIDWLENADGSKNRSDITDQRAKDTVSPAIVKTKLEPINLNGVGIIPSSIAGLSSSLWVGSDEEQVAAYFSNLPELRFSRAQTLLKRILIIESDPPKSSKSSKNAGHHFLLARINKLMDIGALDEAETLILKAKPLNDMIFQKWVQISFLTGRLSNICRNISQTPRLSKDLSLNIICLARSGDWNAAALILSNASALEQLTRETEKILTLYLDPEMIEDESFSETQESRDPMIFYIREINGLTSTQEMLPPKFLYNDLHQARTLRRKVSAAEKLAQNRAISEGILFNIYRSTKPAGSGGIWERMDAVQKLDNSLISKNWQLIQKNLERCIIAMYEKNLLTQFADEYYPKLARFWPQTDTEKLNELISVILVLNGKIPDPWRNYVSKKPKLALALLLAKSEDFDVLDLKTYVYSIQKNSPNFDPFFSFEATVEAAAAKDETQGHKIISALRLVADGIDSNPTDLQKSLLLLDSAGQDEFAKTLLIEFLIKSMQFE